MPYLSVCATSSHDISPLRLWWKEDRPVTQRYYNQVLGLSGQAPQGCTADLCRQIIVNHLHSPSMLAIFPLQDRLSIDNRLKRPEPADERINIPSIAQHYWRYRMHLTLEELIEAEEFNNRMKELIQDAERGNVTS